MAAALLTHHLDALGCDAVVRSAGTRPFSLSVDRDAVDAVSAWGVDLSGHRPRHVDRSIVESDGHDLIITMTRGHLRDVAAMERTAWKRTFTLRELVRRASSRSRGDDWTAWLADLGEGRRPTDLLGEDPDDDITDPYGKGAAAVAATASELRDLTGSLSLLVPWHTKQSGHI